MQSDHIPNVFSGLHVSHHVKSFSVKTFQELERELEPSLTVQCDGLPDELKKLLELLQQLTIASNVRRDRFLSALD